MTYEDFVTGYILHDKRRIKVWIPSDDVHVDTTDYELGTLPSLALQEIGDIEKSWWIVGYQVDQEFTGPHRSSFQEQGLEHIEWLDE